MRPLSAAIALALGTSCTPYIHDCFLCPGGYSDTQIAPDTWIVRVRGNGYTSRERTADFAVMRAAELAMQNHFRWFAIVGDSGGSDQAYAGSYYHSQWTGNGLTAFSVPFTFSMPHDELRVRMYSSDPPQNAFEASFAYESIRRKYWGDDALSKTPAPESTATAAPTAERLKELDQMLFDGSITNEEYSQKRKALLGGV